MTAKKTLSMIPNFLLTPVESAFRNANPFIAVFVVFVIIPLNDTMITFGDLVSSRVRVRSPILPSKEALMS